MNDLDPAMVHALLGGDGENDPPSEPSRISATAEEFGVTYRTLRFYEKLGFLAPDRDGAKRLYSARDRRRLRVVLLCRQIGFTLEEAREIIEIGEMPGSVQQRANAVLPRFVEQQPRLAADLDRIDAALAALDTAEAFLRRELGSLRGRS